MKKIIKKKKQTETKTKKQNNYIYKNTLLTPTKRKTWYKGGLTETEYFRPGELFAFKTTTNKSTKKEQKK